MRLNGSVVVTPMDNPGQFDPDWRNSIVNELLEPGSRIDPEHSRYRNDPWIRLQLSYLRAEDRHAPLTQSQRMYRLANLWFGGSSAADVRFRLEPLLLTSASYEVIAMDILGSCDCVGAVEAYEKMYFNIRDDDGRLNKSCQLRQYFALPSGEFDQNTPPEQLWKLIGSLMGYDTLVSVWLWKDAHGIVNNSQEYLLDEMWRLAQSRLFMSMFADRVGHESMAKLLSAVSAQQKMLSDSKSAGGSAEVDIVRAMQGMLGLASPEVIDAVASDVDRAEIEAAVSSRLRAESAVRNTVLDVTGPDGVRLVSDDKASV